MRHVEMRHLAQRIVETMEQVARLEQRDVERPAVEADERSLRVHPRGDHRQERTFVLEARQQKLSHPQAAILENRAADEKRLRAGAAGEAGRLEIEEAEPRSVRP